MRLKLLFFGIVTFLFKIFILFILGFIHSGAQSFEQAEDFNDFSELNLKDLMNMKVSVATKNEQKISEAPGIVTVITADDIKNIGAKELKDILQIVPGFEFSMERNAIFSIGVRGVKNSISSKILLMVDGVPQNAVMYGFISYAGDFFNIDDIQRIEIIRGTGSALYGRNAFQSVINIITKEAKTNKQEGYFTIGSYNTSTVGFLIDKINNNFNLHINLKKHQTNGNDSKYDNGYGGKSTWTIHRDNFYLDLKSAYKNLKFQMSYVELNPIGTIGPFITQTFLKVKKGSYSLSFDHSLSEKISYQLKGNIQHFSENQDLEIFKANLPGIYGLLWPAGRYVNPTYDEYKYQIQGEIHAQYFENLSFLSGLLLEKYGVKNCRIRSNYDIWNPAAPALFYFNETDTLRMDTLYYTRTNMPYDQGGWIKDGKHDYYNIAFFAQSTYYPFHNIGITLGTRWARRRRFSASG